MKISGLYQTRNEMIVSDRYLPVSRVGETTLVNDCRCSSSAPFNSTKICSDKFTRVSFILPQISLSVFWTRRRLEWNTMYETLSTSKHGIKKISFLVVVFIFTIVTPMDSRGSPEWNEPKHEVNRTNFTGLIWNNVRHDRCYCYQVDASWGAIVGEATGPRDQSVSTHDLNR